MEAKYDAFLAILGREGDRLRGGATIGLEGKDLAEFMDLAIAVDHSTVSGRVVLLKRVINVPDIETDADYNVAAIRPITSVRSMLGVPLLRNGEAEGAFFLGKIEPGAFGDRESELVQTFADQAMIARISLHPASRSNQGDFHAAALVNGD